LIGGKKVLKPSGKEGRGKKKKKGIRNRSPDFLFLKEGGGKKRKVGVGRKKKNGFRSSTPKALFPKKKNQKKGPSPETRERFLPCAKRDKGGGKKSPPRAKEGASRKGASGGRGRSTKGGKKGEKTLLAGGRGTTRVGKPHLHHIGKTKKKKKKKRKNRKKPVETTGQKPLRGGKKNGYPHLSQKEKKMGRGGGRGFVGEEKGRRVNAKEKRGGGKRCVQRGGKELIKEEVTFTKKKKKKKRENR